MGAVTPTDLVKPCKPLCQDTRENVPGRDMIQASEIWAIETPLFFAIDSTLKNGGSASEHPGESEDARRDDLLRSLSVIVPFQHSIAITPCCCITKRPRCQSTSKRGPRNGTDAQMLERREHLALLFAIYEIVVVLHRDEGCEVVVDRVVLHRVD
jgi:hypothetical protein